MLSFPARVLVFAAALWSIAPLASNAAAMEPPSEAVVLLAPPEAAPDVAYTGGDGAPATLGDLKGKLVIANFWATWCAPCVKELPSLDRLAAKLDPERFQVLALSTDRKAEKADAFLKELGIENLAADHDAKRALARAFKLRGLPTTYVIDAGGMVVAKLEGVAEWDSAEFVAWFEALGPKADQ